LSSHPVPKWYKNAKFGIFVHWGVYSVPADNEWFLVFMSPQAQFGKNLGGPPYTASQGNLSDSVFHANIRKQANKYQREKYGNNFAYDDFIPMFKARHYNPGKWAALFKRAGARYVIMTAKHGDEFALWPSKYDKRNAMNMGPHQDLVGKLTKAVRSQGIKMGYYINTTYSFWDKRYPSKKWVRYNNNCIKELVDMYHPAILWGDVRIGPARNKKGKPLGANHWNSKKMIAYFYNHSKHPNQVVTNDRWGLDMTDSTNLNSRKELSQSIFASRARKMNIHGTLLGDYETPERRNVSKIFRTPWETVDSMDPNSWGYDKFTSKDDYMTTNELVDYLADIVSKGGNLVINIGPKADGTIPKVMQDRLRGIGKWLAVNGEAIYGTQPWAIYGQGPTKGEVGSWNNKENKYHYKPGDVRFTKKGNDLFAILLGWPNDHKIVLKSKKFKRLAINNISMLGSDKKIHWKKTANGLSVSLPSQSVSPYANTLKIQCDKL